MIEPSFLRLVGEEDSPRALLAAWTRWMQARGLATRTIDERNRIIHRLSKATGEHPLALSSDGIETFLASIAGASTRCTYYAAIKAWTSWLTRTARRPDDPIAALGTPRQPRRQPHPISTQHLEHLLASRMHRRTRAMILIGAYQGFRVHEIAKVRGEDIDIVGNKFRVDGKGGVVEWTELHPVIATLAADWPARGWWFPSYDEDNRPLRANSVSNTISDAMSRARVPGTAHSLRHWYATELIRSGADARTVQTCLRHATMNHIAIYTQIADSQRVAAILRLPLVNTSTPCAEIV